MVRVGVLRGGPSSEYDVSLKTGASVLRNLPEEKYTPVDIFVSRDGRWHLRGMPIGEARALAQVDVVFNALHGEYGEDGTVQQLLDLYKVPYTGSRAFASAIAMNKATAKRMLEESEMLTPRYAVIEYSNLHDGTLETIFESLGERAVVKPASLGSSVGVAVVDSYALFASAVARALEYSGKVLVEEYINGKEATCGIVDWFRNEEWYAMLPIEIVRPSNRDFFDYETKYGDEAATSERCPGCFSKEESAEVQRLARDAHRLLGLRHYSRSDFMIKDGQIYFLEANTLPGLTETSLVPKALAAVGCTFPQFIDHLVQLALEES